MPVLLRAKQVVQDGIALTAGFEIDYLEVLGILHNALPRETLGNPKIRDAIWHSLFDNAAAMAPYFEFYRAPDILEMLESEMRIPQEEPAVAEQAPSRTGAEASTFTAVQHQILEVHLESLRQKMDFIVAEGERLKAKAEGVESMRVETENLAKNIKRSRVSSKAVSEDVKMSAGQGPASSEWQSQLPMR